MPIETMIYTIRHAHTPYNAEKRYAGTLDVPLSERGIREACQASGRLAGIKFDVVITSTLHRSIATAQYLISNAATFFQCPLCNERNFGVLEGHTWDEVQKFDPPVLFITVGKDQHSVNPKGGEPFEEVWDRAKKLRDLIFHEYVGLSSLVVSHGVFLQMFHGLLRGLSCIESLADYPSNLELTRFRFLDGQLVGEHFLRLIGIDDIAW
jgi:broad specificity phosphatase PhoE